MGILLAIHRNGKAERHASLRQLVFVFASLVSPLAYADEVTDWMDMAVKDRALFGLGET